MRPGSSAPRRWPRRWPCGQLCTWAWRCRSGSDAAPGAAAVQLLRQLMLWFLWPAWLLGLWTLWRWRGHLAATATSGGTAGAGGRVAGRLRGRMGASDRALMLGPARVRACWRPLPCPPSSAAPRRRSTGFRCSSSASSPITIWVLYAAMQTGVPAKPAANIAKLAPGFDAQFSGAIAVGLAVLATLAWLAGALAHRQAPQALWKSLVLPAGGVALAWLLLMTLWLPSAGLRAQQPALGGPHRTACAARDACVWRRGYSRAALASLEVSTGGWRVDGRSGTESGCVIGLRLERRVPDRRRTCRHSRAGCRDWIVARVRRPTDREDHGGDAPPRQRKPPDGQTRCRSAPGSRRVRERWRSHAHPCSRQQQTEPSSPCQARSRSAVRRRGAAPRA